MKNKIYNISLWGINAPTKEQFVKFLHELGITDEFIGIYEEEREDEFDIWTETYVSVFTSEKNHRKIKEF